MTLYVVIDTRDGEISSSISKTAIKLILKDKLGHNDYMVVTSREQALAHERYARVLTSLWDYWTDKTKS